MLLSLSIQNVVLIDQLDIDFSAGLCALTGETGAGKSILLDSMGLALGARSDSGLVRKGTDKAGVTAVFELPSGSHPAKTLLEEADMDAEDTLILRRSISADGRSKAFVNDQPVSVKLLKALGEELVEIHGQFETQGLMNQALHRNVLDEYAALDLSALQNAWSAWRESRRALESLQSDAQQSRADEDYLRQALEDLDALAPQAGEEEELAALRERLMHREQVLENLNSAYQSLNAEQDPVRQAWGALERISDKLGERGKAGIEALEQASMQVQEALSAIQATLADFENEEHDLESVDERLFGLRAQARKHNCGVDELPDMREDLAQKLNRIDNFDDVLREATKAEEAAKAQYIKEAESASKARKTAGTKLDGLVQKELPHLKLEKARFVTAVYDLEEGEWGPHGMDRVQFLVATNPGAEPGPLNKIASGGEMARFMLALKVVMAQVGHVATMVFDEVDSGVGGSTADAVGERLAILAREKGRQVLVVTHSPQVAARAGHHYIVKKDGAQELKTNVVYLPETQQRREEIARMLAGAEITEEARAAAQKLMETGT